MLTPLLVVASAFAADWPILQGTETGDAPAPVRAWGFVQVLGEGIVGSEDASWGASIRRARLGLRGAAPTTDGRVAYLIAAELGDNAITRVDPAVLTDASVTVSYLPGARLRVGQFKLPLGEEALEMNAIAAEFVNFSAATGQLLVEDPVAGGAYVGGSSGFRGVGAQLFDSFEVGEGALSYAVMVSNGRLGSVALDDARDVTGRVAWSPFVWGDRSDPHREELTLTAFWQQGRRDLDGVDADRIRRGVGVELERQGWHARAEILQGSGAIEAAPSIAGAPVVVAAEGEAVGGYTSVHYGRGLLGGGLRYDELHRRTDAPADLRVFRTATADLQLQPTPKVRLLVDYEARWSAAPGGSEYTRATAATLGDRVSVQVGAVF